MSFLKKNWFIAGIIITLVLGIVISDIGIRLNTGSVFSTVLIILIFVMIGLGLPLSTIKVGLRDIRIHIYIQAFIFLVVPLYFYLTTLMFKNSFHPQIIIGIYALSVLPCTISSCIVFTQSAGGNVVASMFNSAFANVSGIIISPLLLSLMLSTKSEMLPFSELFGVLQKLALIMLLPIGFGQFLRRWLAPAATAHKKQLGVLSNVFILLILFFTYSKSAGEPTFFENIHSISFVYIYLAISFLFLNFLALFGARFIGFSIEDQIAVNFTAPQKTLAMGVPLLSTFFASSPELIGITLLPLIFYHAWQLLVAGVLKELIKKRSIQH